MAPSSSESLWISYNMIRTCLYGCILQLVVYQCQSAAIDEGDMTVDWPRRNPEIYSLHIRSDIVSRFATTRVVSFLVNNGQESKEAVFNLNLPKAAFISNFTMEIDGKLYGGEVKEKLVAKREYEKAKSKGKSAGQVSAETKARNTNAFKVAVNVAPQSKVQFKLIYQELLERRLGTYQHIININPKQVVRDLEVKVYLTESKDITTFKVPPLRRNVTDFMNGEDQENPLAVIRRPTSKTAEVTFKPNIRQQLQASSQGMSGQFVVQYDIQRDLGAGEIKVVDGYFVHYFAPSGLQPVPKNILFIIDISGSMSGIKISQTKDAMNTILGDLRPHDMFSIVMFSDYVRFWTDKMMPANPVQKEKGKTFVQKTTADGGTNINDALLRGIEFLKQQEIRSEGVGTSMIIFLTDGFPTSGITSTDRILANVRQANQERVTVFALGFGQGVSFPFLQKVSLQNRGLARRIYEDADASLQLEGFYNEVSTPVLADINISYLGDVIEINTLTQSEFPTYFRGSELVVAGKLKDNNIPTLSTVVSGSSATGDLELDLRVPVRPEGGVRSEMSNFTERLWAYLTIKKLLDKMVRSDNATEKEAAQAQALDLSLKYSFVTPLTSMIVVKPGQPKSVGELDEEDEETHGNRRRHSHRSPMKPAYSRKSFVDNDPHFIVIVPGIAEGICFDVTGKPADIYQLLHDKDIGVAVNGYIVGKNLSKHQGNSRTYFGRIAVLLQNIDITVSPSKIQINRVTFRWNETRTLDIADNIIQIYHKDNVTITVGEGVVFSILRHKVKSSSPNKLDFLGFYIKDGSGLSTYTHGLIGQFQYQTVEFHKKPSAGKHGQSTAALLFKGPHTNNIPVKARFKKRRNMALHKHVPCWYIKNNGEGLLAGSHLDYLVPRLNFRAASMTANSVVGTLPMYSFNNLGKRRLKRSNTG